MGNEINRQENEENNSEIINNDEIPADTQLNKQYIENINDQENQYNQEIISEKENQNPNHIIIKIVQFQNKNVPNSQYNERKVEYQIRKVNQESESNAEEEFDSNQREELENEKVEFQEGMEYDDNTNQVEQNISNFQNNSYTQDENNSKEIIITKKTSSNKGEYQNKNLRIIPGSTSQGRYTQIYSDIPRFMSFQKSKLKGSANIKGNLNVVKTENTTELVEIPKSEYPSYVGKETVFIGGGMATGEYKFQGQGIVITQCGNIENNVVFNEEEIMKEINRRNNKPKKQKRKKIEIIEKFYATTQFDGKPIYKTEKMEQILKQDELNLQNKFKKEHNNEVHSSSNDINKKYFESQYEQYQESNSNSQLNSKMFNINNNNKDINIRYKDLDTNLEPKDTFSKIIFNKINKLRANPQSYIQTIEESKKNVIIDNKGRLIYNSKIRIALAKGIQTFNEAINYLKTIKPSQKLIFNPYLTVTMPKNENEIKNKNDLEIKVDNLMKDGYTVKSFWRDVIKDPEICFLMTIVDDIGVKSGMRRQNLLDSNMKYIGINSVDINGIFVCYVVLSN